MTPHTTRFLAAGVIVVGFGTVAFAGFRSLAAPTDLTCREFSHGMYIGDSDVKHRVALLLEPAMRLGAEPDMLLGFVGARCSQSPDLNVADIVTPFIQYITDHKRN
jgi:hypothetical protein